MFWISIQEKNAIDGWLTQNRITFHPLSWKEDDDVMLNWWLKLNMGNYEGNFLWKMIVQNLLASQWDFLEWELLFDHDINVAFDVLHDTFRNLFLTAFLFKNIFFNSINYEIIFMKIPKEAYKNATKKEEFPFCTSW